MLKHCAANRKRRLSALPNVGPYIYIYTTLKFLALHGAPYIYDVSRLRIKRSSQRCVFHCAIYTDFGMALNLNRLMVSAPPVFVVFLDVFYQVKFFCHVFWKLMQWRVKGYWFTDTATNRLIHSFVNWITTLHNSVQWQPHFTYGRKLICILTFKIFCQVWVYFGTNIVHVPPFVSSTKIDLKNGCTSRLVLKGLCCFCWIWQELFGYFLGVFPAPYVDNEQRTACLRLYWFVSFAINTSQYGDDLEKTKVSTLSVCAVLVQPKHHLHYVYSLSLSAATCACLVGLCVLQPTYLTLWRQGVSADASS
jgi:hypothetical protein